MKMGRYYATVMPVAGLLYLVALLLTDNRLVTVGGAILIALLAVLGTIIGRSRQ